MSFEKIQRIQVAQDNIELLAKEKVSDATHHVVEGRIVQKSATSKVFALFRASHPSVHEAALTSITTFQKAALKSLVSLPRAEQKAEILKYQEIAFKVIANTRGSGSPALEQAIEETLATGVEGLGLASDALKGLQAGRTPQPTSGGASGSYFVFNKAGERIGVFKPSDEEMGGPNNDGGYLYGRSGITVGQGPVREYIAHALDHEGFAGTPHVAVTKLMSRAFRDVSEPSGLAAGLRSEKTKKGALVEFVEHQEIGLMMVDMAKVDPSSVRRIAILDVRLWNSDRHMDNYFVVRNPPGAAHELSLRPLDQGFAFSQNIDDMRLNPFSWMSLEAAEQPFSGEEIDYINRLDTKSDAQVMRAAGFAQIHVDQMVLSTLLLQEGVKAGLNARQMGEMLTDMARDRPTVQTLLHYSGDRADTATREAMRPGYLFNGLAAEQVSGFRTEAFIKDAQPHIAALVADKAASP